MNNDNSNNYNQQAQQILQETMQKMEASSQQPFKNINPPPYIDDALGDALGVLV